MPQYSHHLHRLAALGRRARQRQPRHTPHLDQLAVDLYPELMNVPQGTGPKKGRYAYPANRGITLRHLICNVSGYMKPGEAPGQVFNYQTYGIKYPHPRHRHSLRTL